MSNSYHKNLVFTAACIGMCFFGVSMITLGSVLPSLVAKLGLSGLQATSLATFLPLGMLVGSLIFGPVVDRFGHKALLIPSCAVVLLGLEGLIFFESIPLLQTSIVGIGLGGGILNGETNALVSDISNESEKVPGSVPGNVLWTGGTGHTEPFGYFIRILLLRDYPSGYRHPYAGGYIVLYPRTLSRTQTSTRLSCKRGVGTAERGQPAITQFYPFLPERHRGSVQ